MFVLAVAFGLPCLRFLRGALGGTVSARWTAFQTPIAVHIGRAFVLSVLHRIRHLAGHDNHHEVPELNRVAGTGSTYYRNKTIILHQWCI